MRRSSFAVFLTCDALLKSGGDYDVFGCSLIFWNCGSRAFLAALWILQPSLACFFDVPSSTCFWPMRPTQLTGCQAEKREHSFSDETQAIQLTYIYIYIGLDIRIYIIQLYKYLYLYDIHPFSHFTTSKSTKSCFFFQNPYIHPYSKNTCKLQQLTGLQFRSLGLVGEM